MSSLGLPLRTAVSQPGVEEIHKLRAPPRKRAPTWRKVRRSALRAEHRQPAAARCLVGVNSNSFEGTDGAQLDRYEGRPSHSYKEKKETMNKRIALAAAFASLLIAAGASSMLAEAAVTPSNGNDFILPNGNVYQLDSDGVYHWIPDVATSTAMHVDGNALQALDALDGPEGAPYPSVVATLSNARVTAVAPAPKVVVTPANGNDFILPNGNVYQLDSDGVYHWIPDVATSMAMHVDGSALQQLDALDGPEGAPFPSVLG
jgi:hypothetical protein